VLAGTASGTAVSAGGYQIVSSGGHANATIVSNGGHELVSSGGSASGATLVGGTLEIQSGGTAGTSVITISSGTLALDGSQHFSGSIAGLATSGVQNVVLAPVGGDRVKVLKIRA